MSEKDLVTYWNDFVDCLFKMTEDLRSVITDTPTNSSISYKASVEDAFNKLPIMFSERFAILDAMIYETVSTETQVEMLQMFLLKLANHSTGTVDVNIDIAAVIDQAMLASATNNGFVDRLMRMMSIMASPDNKVILHESMQDILDFFIAILKNHAMSKTLIQSLSSELTHEKLKNDKITNLENKINNAKISLDTCVPDSEKHKELEMEIMNLTSELSLLVHGNDIEVLKLKISQLEAANQNSAENEKIATLTNEKVLLEKAIEQHIITYNALKEGARSLSAHNETEQHEANTTKLELEKEALANQNKSLLEENLGHKARVSELQEALAKQNKSLHEENLGHTGMVSESQEALTKQNKSIMDEIVNELQVEKEALAKQNKSILEENIRHTTIVSELQVEKEALTKQYKNFETNSASLLEENLRLKDAQSNTKNVVVLEKENMILKQDNTTLKKQMNALTVNEMSLRTQLVSMRNETIPKTTHEQVTTELTQISKQNATLIATNTTLKLESSKQDGIITNLNASITALNTELAKTQLLYKGVQETMHQLKSVHLNNTKIIDNFDMQNMTKYKESVSRKLAMIKLERMMKKIGSKITMLSATSDNKTLRDTLDDVLIITKTANTNEFDHEETLEKLLPLLLPELASDLQNMFNTFDEMKDRVTSINETFATNLDTTFRD